MCRAFARAGSAYERKEDLVSAVRFYNKSLAEHRTPDVLTKLKAAEKAQKEQEARAYENPELSDAARAEGNALFKGGDFAGSVKSYTEAIKRNPTDARGYTNRASAYTKLLALNEALKDADKAIEVSVPLLSSCPVARSDWSSQGSDESQRLYPQSYRPVWNERIRQGDICRRRSER